MKKVRGLGSVREGTMHFWRQRLTALANVPLTLFFVGLLIALNGQDYEYTRSVLGNPFVALMLACLISLHHFNAAARFALHPTYHPSGGSTRENPFCGDETAQIEKSSTR